MAEWLGRFVANQLFLDRAWDPDKENVRKVQNCLVSSPPKYSGAICALREVLFAIRYHQLVQDVLVKQANRVVDFLLVFYNYSDPDPCSTL